ncbi:hypothetical protein CBS101457_002593 [Exobasidium rhododendri]|nr:hypothetical protein CBS101457_002593 [Exobasidium rhododendri]
MSVEERVQGYRSSLQAPSDNEGHEQPELDIKRKRGHFASIDGSVVSRGSTERRGSKRRLRESTKEEAGKRDKRDQHPLQRHRPKGDLRAGIVVQDRSKSKAARIKEESKRNERLRRRENIDDCRTNHANESAAELGLSKQRSEKQGEYQQKRFSKHVQQFTYDDHGRGRITGIFGKGMSSGHHHVAAKNSLPNQGPEEMARIGAGKRRRSERELVSESESSDRESEIDLPSDSHDLPRKEQDSARRLRQRRRLNEREQSLKREIQERKRANADGKHNRVDAKVDKALRSLYERIKKYREAKDESPASSVTQTSESRSACSDPPHRAKREKESTKETSKAQVEGGEGAQRMDALTTAVDAPTVKEVPLPSPPELTPEVANAGLPPYLAFDGNRPHQHANAWRGQHTRREDGFQGLRELYEEQGGPVLPFSRPIEYTMVDEDSREEKKEQQQQCGGEGQTWEIMRSEIDQGDGVQPSKDTLEISDDLLDYPHCRQHQHEPFYSEEQRDQHNAYHEYIEGNNFDDAIYESRLQDMFQEEREEQDPVMGDYAAYRRKMQRPIYIDAYYDTTFDPSVDAAGTADPTDWVDDIESREIDFHDDFFDGDQEGLEGEWVDQASCIDQFEPPPHVESAALDVRAATRPTCKDLEGFWQPQ